MEMEKINDNTMRVILSKEDLAERGLSTLDLIGNQEEVEEFFYSILDEVDSDNEFRDNGAVTFQLVPNGEGVELFITKVDPSKIDDINLPGDSEFDENNSVMLSNLSANDLDNLGLDNDVTKILKDHLEKMKEQNFGFGIEPKQGQVKDQKKENNEKDKASASPNHQTASQHQETDESENEFTFPKTTESVIRIVEFDSMQNMLNFAEKVNFNVNFVSDLFEMDDKYYMIIGFQFEDVSDEIIDNVYCCALEYGNPVKFAPIYLKEHGHLIKTQDAFEWLKYSFA